MSSTPSTSVNLLEQLRDRRNTAAWERWLALYTPLMRLWLRSASLQPADVDDLTQRVLAVVVRKLPTFAHNGRAGAFRTWLRTIMANELRAFSRGRSWAGEDVLDQLVDPSSDINRWWDQEHDRQMLRELLELIRSEFTPSTWKAFLSTVLDERPTEQVAGELGLSENAVLIAKSRVLARLRSAARDWIGEVL